MANKTTNYDLEKPLESEYYSVEVQNRNMDKIDAALASNAAAVRAEATSRAAADEALDGAISDEAEARESADEALSEAVTAAAQAASAAQNAANTAQQTADGKQSPLTFDTTPKSGSTNPVTSGGIYTALSAKADKATQVSVTLSTNWSGSTAPYTQAIGVTGATAASIGFLDVAQSATAAQREAARAALLYVTAQGAGTMTVTADGEVPTVAIPCVVTLFG